MRNGFGRPARSRFGRPRARIRAGYGSLSLAGWLAGWLVAWRPARRASRNYQDSVVVESLANVAGTAAWNLSVPNAPALAGLQFFLRGLTVFLQGLTADPGANAFGATSTNAVSAIVEP